MTSVPVKYVPPPVTVPPPDGSAAAVKVKTGRKRAWKMRGPFIVKVHEDPVRVRRS